MKTCTILAVNRAKHSGWYAVQMSLVLLLLVSNAKAGLFGPNNYEECILQKMEGVTSDLAAKSIIRACRKLFREKNPECAKIKFSNNEVENIAGKGRFAQGRMFLEIYNGNADISITDIWINIRDKNTNDPRVYHVSLVFSAIAPLTQGSSNFEVMLTDVSPGSWSWTIVAAQGCRK